MLGASRGPSDLLADFRSSQYLGEWSEKLAERRANATVNRTLELLRAILRKCVNEWEWLDRAPHVRMLKERTRRIRYLTPEEAKRLLEHLTAHLADMAAFSLATGLRAANVTGLQWTQANSGHIRFFTINYLHLPTCTPATIRHKPVTPDLSSTRSRHGKVARPSIPTRAISRRCHSPSIRHARRRPLIEN